MSVADLRLLLIEDNPGDARLVREILRDVPGPRVEVETADRLDAGLALLREGGFDAVLLDLSLPDAQGMASYVSLREQTPDVPVIVVTGLDDEATGLQALKEGAQDYLVKGRIDGPALLRSIRYAIERHRMQTRIRELSLTDDLTGLYNRRGFTTLARQHWKLAARSKTPLLLAFLDVDGLKQINDTYGHSEGDAALVRAAAVLRESFRDSDVLARIGGDEFTVLALDPPADDERVLERLEANLRAYNQSRTHPWELSISAGVTRIDPTAPTTIEQVLAKADADLYERKRARRKA